ncbi:hypothetical protein V8G54_018435, partial [Vigna mungo]
MEEGIVVAVAFTSQDRPLPQLFVRQERSVVSLLTMKTDFTEEGGGSTVTIPWRRKGTSAVVAIWEERHLLPLFLSRRNPENEIFLWPFMFQVAMQIHRDQNQWKSYKLSQY